MRADEVRVTRRGLLRGVGALGALTALGGTLGGPLAGQAAAADRLVSATARTAARTSLVRVHCERSAISALAESFDVTEHVGHGWVEVVAHPGDLLRLDRLGLSYDVTVEDLVGQFTADRLVELQRAEAEPQTRTTYRTLAEYQADMARLVQLAPNLVAPFELPTPTHEGRRLRGIRLGGDVARAATDGRATALICGLHHAREWPSGELTIMFAEDLVDRYLKGEAETVALLDQIQLLIIPVCNPDGFVRSRETIPYQSTVDGLTQLAQEGPYHRKNLRGNLAGLPVEPQQGVDTNRNYPYRWGGVGSSSSSTSQTYSGPAPGSEPEVVAVMDLFRRTQVLTAISNHTHGRLVLRPWGYTNQPAPDEEALAALGDAMAAHNGYRSGLWNVALYPGTGIIDDWSYGLFGTYCYTLEHGSAFHPVYGDNVPQQYHSNRPAFLELLRTALDPAHHGILTGTAPAGTVLTLSKDVASPLSRVSGGSSQVADRCETSMVVGDDGTFTWHVNPSPTATTLLAIEDGEASAADREAYTLTVARPGGSTTTQQLLVERGRTYELSL
jgi:hypothetical protein